MRNLLRSTLAAIALSVALCAPAFAAQPNPGSDWMLEGPPIIKKNFVPDPSDISNSRAGHQGSRTNNLATDANKTAAQARSASAQKAMKLTGSTAVRAAGGGSVIDITQLVHRLSNGPVDFGSGGIALYQLTAAGNGNTSIVTFRAYQGSSLLTGTAATLQISGSRPTAGNGALTVNLTKVSRDGSTLDGQFKGPNGQAASLTAQ